jgi:hypothetical protein
MFYGGYNPNQYNWAVGHATSLDGISWRKDTLNNPVLFHGPPGSWDSESIHVSSVLYDGSIFHLWYAGVYTGNVNWKIGYAWSFDGIEWIKYDDSLTTSILYAESDPVLDVGPPNSWDASVIKYPHVIRVRDSLKMWYGGRNGDDWAIGYATSIDGIEWIKYSQNPILLPGSSQCWDYPRIDDPCVVFDGNIYHMFYNGGLLFTFHQIGYAWSEDGKTWGKYDNPTTTEWPYAISDPVLRPGPNGSWDYFWVGDPWVIIDIQTGTMRMWYTGYYNRRHIGYATGVMDPIVPALNFGE